MSRLTFGIAVFTGLLVCVGLLQWRTYENTLATTKTIERAWVTVIDFKFGRRGADPMAIVEVKNSGRLPGVVEDRAIILLTKDSQPADNPADMGWYFEHSTAVVPPGHTARLLVPFPGANFTQQEWEQIKSGGRPVSVYGLIKYKTGFAKIDGETGYGFVQSNDGTAFAVSDAPGYNYAK